MSQTTCELPQKLFYRIQEVSRITGVKPYVLRYWETEFPSLKPEKGPNDQRRYRAGDIDLVRRIKRLLYEEKFTIAGARKHLDGNGGSAERISAGRHREAKTTESPRKATIAHIAHRLGLIRKEMIELQAFLAG
jgi:DNA-binding transcriptional MerR regulator